ncbi:MAG: hypothetical protein GF315_01395 [candidate division Zixibacteria bacterium]|nr:hypothetical protein [candidate division Zixibacteria bacterium]
MTWKKFIYRLIIEFCNDRGNRTFTLKEFTDNNKQEIKNFRPSAKTPFNTVRRVLQELRNDDLISFVDYSGTYTLRGVDLLRGEVEDEKLAEVESQPPIRKEYLIETFVRDIGWVREAKSRFGLYCMCPGCINTFRKQDGNPYIEVHHIIPLCHGGEQGIWNLSVVCAHHHRMAHFADSRTQNQLQSVLKTEVEERLKRFSI